MDELAAILVVANDDRLWRAWCHRLATEARVLRFDSDIREALGMSYFSAPVTAGVYWDSDWSDTVAMSITNRQRIVAWTWHYGRVANASVDAVEVALGSMDFAPMSVYERVRATTLALRAQFKYMVTPDRNEWDLALWLEDHNRSPWPVSAQTLLDLCIASGIVVADAKHRVGDSVWRLSARAARKQKELEATQAVRDDQLLAIAVGMSALGKAVGGLALMDPVVEGFHSLLPPPLRPGTKYRPWFDFFDAQAAGVQKLRLTADEMEQMLGDRTPTRGRGGPGLPASARTKPSSWWVNASRKPESEKRSVPTWEWRSHSNITHPAAWLAAGFKVQQRIELDAVILTFSAMPRRERWYARRDEMRSGRDAKGRELVSMHNVATRRV